MKEKVKIILTDKIPEWIRNHYIISASVLFAIVIVIVAVVVFSVRGSKANSGSESVANTGETISEANSEGEVDARVLECDAYPEINDVIGKYYTALASNDQTAVQDSLYYVSDTILESVAVKSEYVEEYRDIHCYTQKGYVDGSYYVYVSYMLKLRDFDVLLPALTGLYYAPNEEGKYVLYNKDDMEKSLEEAVIQDYYEAFYQEDVQQIYANVDAKYVEILDANPDLKTFLDGFEALINNEVAKRIAVKEASEALVQAQTEEPDLPQEPVGEQSEVTTDTVIATTTVNVRSSDSETADKLGKVASGTTLTRLEEKVNGWSKVLYEGNEGYIKTEFLEVVEAAAGGDATIGYVTVLENVNIRASASEEGERLALAYQGEKFELIEKMANGWSKIKYEGSVAYVKSDFVQ